MKKHIVLLFLFLIFMFSFMGNINRVSANETPTIQTNLVSEDHYVFEINGIILDAVKNGQTAYYNYYDIDGNLFYAYTADLNSKDMPINVRQLNSNIQSRQIQQLDNNVYKTSNEIISPYIVCEDAYTCNLPPAPSTYYNWDSVRYLYTTRTMVYDHPDKEYYNISPYLDWSKDGANYTHYQLDKFDSDSITSLTPWAIGAGIGTVIGIIVAGPFGAAAGVVIGAMIGAAIGAWTDPQIERLLDEDGCLWIVIDSNVTKDWEFWPSLGYYYNIDYLSIGDHYGTLSFQNLHLGVSL